MKNSCRPSAYRTALDVVLLLLCCAPFACGASLEQIQHSVVKVYSTIQRPDYLQPWQAARPAGGSGSGFIISKRRILTNAHIVSDARFIEIQREGDARKYQAEVEFAGHDCDLAILKVKDERFFDGTKPLAFGNSLPGLDDEVIVLGYPLGGTRLSLTKGVVSRIDYNLYSHSGVDLHLVLQVDAAINPGNSGGPVIFNGKVVGLAFQGLRNAQNIGYAIPLPVINHFLKDIEDGDYNGYPELGVLYVDTRNPALRADLQLPDDQGGVAISYVDPYGAAVGWLKPGDVLLSVDQHAIASDGTVKLDDNTVEFAELLERKQWGESVPMTVWRDNKALSLTVPLRNPVDPFCFRQDYDRQPQYLVVCGLVFSPLTRGYLVGLRGGLNSAIAQRLLYYSKYAKIDGLYKGRTQFVVLIDRLPHPANTYDEYFINQIVSEVNGTNVTSLKDMEAALSRSTNGFHVIRFEGAEDRLVIPVRAAADADRAIMEQYKLPALSHFEVEDAQ